MSHEVLVVGVLLVALVLFVWGRWRYDLVAVAALLALTLSGAVPAADAFLGFGHAAVVSVAAVLVISRGLQNSGVVDMIARGVARVGKRPTAQVAALTGLVIVCSAFMNNVGALALLLPVAIRMARDAGHPPSILLMPLAFGSLLGGMMTLIGTPANIIIATFRGANGQAPFGMFDYAPVGVGVALAGWVFLTLGWRLIPRRQGPGSPEERFKIAEYMTELRVPEGCKLIGEPARAVVEAVDGDCVLAGIVRGKRRLSAPSGFELLREGDVLLVEAEAEKLKELAEQAGLELVGDYEFKPEDLREGDVGLHEAVVMPEARVVGRTVRNSGAGWRHGVNILAVAREGGRLKQRLSGITLRAGDVLLLQAREEALAEALRAMGCLPLAERGVRLGQPRRIVLCLGVFAAARAAAALHLAPVPVALVTAAAVLILLRIVTLDEAYGSIDWSVIVLLAAMIPVGQALETSGATARLANAVAGLGPLLGPAALLTLLVVVTMVLSDIVNNAAAAVLMAPVAFGVARGLEVSPDPLLMGVAVAASCAFLTPIGHQSNTLVLGPGGYRFGDYWRLGLPLQLIVLAVTIPLILVFWPLTPTAA